MSEQQVRAFHYLAQMMREDGEAPSPEPPSDRELLWTLAGDVAALRLAVEAIRTDLSTFLAEREPEAVPEPRPLRAGGGVMYWPTTGSSASGEPR